MSHNFISPGVMSLTKLPKGHDGLLKKGSITVHDRRNAGANPDAARHQTSPEEKYPPFAKQKRLLHIYSFHMIHIQCSRVFAVHNHLFIMFLFPPGLQKKD